MLLQTGILVAFGPISSSNALIEVDNAGFMHFLSLQVDDFMMMNFLISILIILFLGIKMWKLVQTCLPERMQKQMIN